MFGNKGVIAISALLFLPLAQTLAYAQSSITIEFDRNSYTPGDIVQLDGRLDPPMSEVLVAIEVVDADGNTLMVRTVQTDTEGNFSLEFRLPQSAQSGELAVEANAAVNGEVSRSSKVIKISQDSSTDSGSVPTSQCIIATAAFGSELAPQVQFLRGFRDNHIMSTAAGSSFMTVFNAWYYSFSPHVADYERNQPWLQQTVRTAIVPLLWILQTSEMAYSALPGEYGAMSAGLVASTMIGAVYFSPLVLATKKSTRARAALKLSLIAMIIAASTIVIAILVEDSVGLMVTTSFLILATIATSALLVARTAQGIVRRWRT